MGFCLPSAVVGAAGSPGAGSGSTRVALRVHSSKLFLSLFRPPLLPFQKCAASVDVSYAIFFIFCSGYYGAGV